jgi:hypothetical protein
MDLVAPGFILMLTLADVTVADAPMQPRPQNIWKPPVRLRAAPVR